jgi:hypothetical protein
MIVRLLALLLAFAPAQVESTGPAPELRSVEWLGTPVASPDGKHVVSISSSFAWLLNARTGEPLFLVKAGNLPEYRDFWQWAQFSADNKHLLLWGDRGSLAYVDVEHPRLLSYESGPSPSGEIAKMISPDLAELLDANSERRYQLDAFAKLKASASQGDYWEEVAIDPDGRATIECHPKLGLAAFQPGDSVPLWKLGGFRLPFVNARSGTLIVKRRVGGAHTVLDLLSGNILWPLPERFVLRAPPAEIGNHHILIADEDGAALTRFEARSGDVDGVLPRSKGVTKQVGVLSATVAWVVSEDGRVETISAADGNTIASRHVPGATRASSQSGRLVVLSEAGKAHVFEGPSLDLVGEFQAGTHLEIALGGSKCLAWGAGVRGVRIHSLPDGELIMQHATKSFQIDHAAWDRTGRVVAGIGRDRLPTLWRDGKRIVLPSLPRSLSVAMNPDGSRLALGRGRSEIDILDAETGQHVQTLRVEDWRIMDEEVVHVEFSPCGKYLVGTTSGFESVQVWFTGTWDKVWVHNFQQGNQFPVETKIDPQSERLWLWGVANARDCCFDLASGEQVFDVESPGFHTFSPGPEGLLTATIQGHALVLLDSTGTPVLRRLDLGQLGVVVATADGKISGDAAAMSRAFVRIGEGFVRADAVGDDR